MKIFQPSINLDKLEDRQYKISEVANLINATTRTLRYWQENKLIKPHGSSHSSIRLYTLEDMKRAVHIKDLQDLFGFSLLEIKQILAIEDRLISLKKIYCQNNRMDQIKLEVVRSALLETTTLLNLIDNKITRIQNYRSNLADMIDKIEKYLSKSEKNH